MNIVCISPSPWDFPIWTNRQHIMKRISKEHKVLYVFHPIFFKSSLKRNISLRQFKIISMLEKVDYNLWTFTPFVSPFSNNYLGIHQINVKISSWFLRKYIKQLGFKEYLLWFYDPEGVAYLDYLKPELTCYDCVDEYSTMPYYNSNKRKKRLKYLERQLMERCDLVFTTSENLFKKKKKFNSNTFLVENVGDFDHFNKASDESLGASIDFPNVKAPVIGFVGALDNYKVDFDLIEYLAVSKPNWSFVLIGSKMSSNERGVAYPKYNNVLYLGRKEYEVLPNYISRFDICIIPYNINNYTNHVFPIKLFEFLATGKPVVTTALPSLGKYKGIIKIANSHEEFVIAMEEALNDDTNVLKEIRINTARSNTWESRKDKLLSHISDFLEAQN